MTWAADPELLEMFLGEVEERSARLVEGSTAMVEGSLSEQLSGEMVRQAHTIKGTGRVMGFDAIARVGDVLERLWREIQQGSHPADEELGALIKRLVEELTPASRANAKIGTLRLWKKLNAVEEAVEWELSEPEEDSADSVDPDLPENGGATAAADTQDILDLLDKAVAGLTPAVADSDEDVDQRLGDTTTSSQLLRYADTTDLGGLLGALNTWATEQAVNVNAGSLYRMINNVASIRLSLQAAFSEAAADTSSAIPDSMIEALAGLDRAAVSLEADALALASVPLSDVTATLNQLVRYLSKKLGKDVSFEIDADPDIFIDRQVRERIADPLRQMVVNAVLHGVELPAEREAAGKPRSAKVVVSATLKENRLELLVADDGAGIDWEGVRKIAVDRGLYTAGRSADPKALTPILFSKGFATIDVTEVGGRGEGLHRVAAAAEDLYGRVTIESKPGEGTGISLVVPTTRALQCVMIVRTGDQMWGFPEATVDDTMPLAEVVLSGSDPETMTWKRATLPVVHLSDVVGTESIGGPGQQLVVVTARSGTVAFVVDSLADVKEVVAKELGPIVAGPSHITGAALLGSGEVVLLLDTVELVDRVSRGPVERVTGSRILVVDDSQGARAIVSGALASVGYATDVASSAAEAIEKLSARGADALVVDFSMPDADGVALVDEVRARFDRLPIVMLSGVATDEDQNRARAAGVDVFLDKDDFREGALADALSQLLSKGESR
ncbi:gliding motility regulatory protein [bacterium BMS3Bbin02]|nr:gliding motility regulatory protein [bacterium BMS3Bbin02]